MSNIGLNSNIYHSTRTYLDLLNDFLIDFNYAKELGKTFTNKDVVDFFYRISDKSIVDPEAQLLRSFFHQFYKKKNMDTEKELAYLAKKIKNEDLDTKSVKEIEELVDILKFQCDQSFRRMKGNG